MSRRTSGSSKNSGGKVGDQDDDAAKARIGHGKEDIPSGQAGSAAKKPGRDYPSSNKTQLAMQKLQQLETDTKQLRGETEQLRKDLNRILRDFVGLLIERSAHLATLEQRYGRDSVVDLKEHHDELVYKSRWILGETIRFDNLDDGSATTREGTSDQKPA